MSDAHHVRSCTRCGLNLDSRPLGLDDSDLSRLTTLLPRGQVVNMANRTQNAEALLDAIFNSVPSEVLNNYMETRGLPVPATPAQQSGTSVTSTPNSTSSSGDNSTPEAPAVSDGTSPNRSSTEGESAESPDPDRPGPRAHRRRHRGSWRRRWRALQEEANGDATIDDAAVDEATKEAKVLRHLQFLVRMLCVCFSFINFCPSGKNCLMLLSFFAAKGEDCSGQVLPVRQDMEPPECQHANKGGQDADEIMPR